MPDRFFSEEERRALERLAWWLAAVRGCILAVLVVMCIGGVIALGPLLLQVAR